MEAKKQVTIRLPEFGWSAHERQTDRYGGINVLKKLLSDEVKSLDGVRVKVEAVVLSSVESGHIGDLEHGFMPTKPSIGEVIELGTGTTWFEECDPTHVTMAFEPTDKRKVCWLDPWGLYRCHAQEVDLRLTVLEPGDQDTPFPFWWTSGSSQPMPAWAQVMKDAFEDKEGQEEGDW